jgi:two-component system, OmpR family, sensor histidine kinase ArlS
MNETKNTKTKVKSVNQTRSSIVIKLNLSMMGLLISAMIAINFVISIIFLGNTLYQNEIMIDKLIKQTEITQSISTNETTFLDYTFVKTVQAKGWQLPTSIQQWLPLQNQSYRSLGYFGDDQLSVFDRILNLEYRVYIPYQDSYIQVSQLIFESMKNLGWILIFLFGFELIMIVSRFSKNHVRIAEALKPLTQLTASAKNLQEDMRKLTSFKKTDIESMTGAISKIDAKKLNQNTFVQYDQEELRELADAINDLLMRINESYQAQVRFVSDASHELRTPIAVIQGYANMLDRWGKSDEKTLNESIEAIKGESDHMKTLIEHLLFLARGDSDTIRLQLENFNVRELLEEVIKEARLIDDDHQYELNPTDPVWIVGDKQLIKQVLRILVDNAMKYSPKHEKIMLKLVKDIHQIHIVVQDNGIGIKPQDVPHIFDRFYRSDESRDKKTGGSGLGLAIAKWIIEKHGGHFEVISRVGIGTRITITLKTELTVK